jgi:phage gp29-like protein
MGLFDAYGRPVKTAELTKEIGDVHLASVRSPYFDSVASSLTPQRLKNVLLDADEGNITDFLTLAEEIEERDLHYRSVLGTRKLALGKLPIRVEVDDDKQEEMRDQIDIIVKSEAFSDLLFSLTDAIAKSFSAAFYRRQRHGFTVPHSDRK